MRERGDGGNGAHDDVADAAERVLPKFFSRRAFNSQGFAGACCCLLLLFPFCCCLISLDLLRNRMAMRMYKMYANIKDN